ncbi:hypothetical protein BZA05DRAFT_474014 [Tricharina praecox]|uniref:uncharacterized protein n=1 Tax=Tricharina praecox TaxID=43433 RepID=UPI00221EA84A|nr:uncharacterized protein BZA05DRAFT_474014 [Tricharina praecox]KAI5851876.1 hypothetical protein BZA05DRAFT_474014 [Tricharina praecox]
MARQRNSEIEEAFTTYKAPDRKRWSVRCNWCQKELAQHAGRQVNHLRLCQPYQRHLREQGIAPTEGRQVVRLGSIKSNNAGTSVSNEISSSPPLDAADEMHESSTVSIRTRSGECRYMVRSGKVGIGCPCRAGEFNIPESVNGWVDIRCNNCAHLIGSHGNCPEDSGSAAAGSVASVGMTTEHTPSKSQRPSDVPVFLNIQSSPRHHIVNALWEQQQLLRVIQIYGPPSSGKSTLAGLLSTHVSASSNSDIEVCSIVCQPLPHLPSHSHWISVLHSIGVPEQFLKSQGPKLLILDDSQYLSPFRNLWNDLIKRETTEGMRNFYIALFSSYSDDDMYLSRKQTVSCRPLPTNNSNVSLYFTREEYHDVMNAVCGPSFKARKTGALVFSEEAREFLYSFTGGHPGCVRSIIGAMKEVQASRSPGEGDLCFIPAVLSTVFARNSVDFSYFLKTSAMQTLFPQSLLASFEQSQIARTMQQVVARQSVTENTANRATLEACCRKGLLISEIDPVANTRTYTTPSLLHRRVYEHLLSHIFPPANSISNLTLIDFISTALRLFSRSSLNHHLGGLLGPGLTIRPSSRLYYDELYRVCWDLMPVVECEKQRGGFELWFPEKRWAIRDKTPARDGEVQEQIWLEFGMVVPKVIDGFTMLPKYLYHVIFKEDYSTCEILDGSLERIDTFELMP